MNFLKILYAASEALPYMASGGLADVAGSLPKAIRNRQQACRVVMPLYGDIKAELRNEMRFVTSFAVPLGWRNQYCGIFEANCNGVIYYFIDNEYYFKRDGLYGFYDDGERFAYFSKAVLEMLNFIDFAPDIINLNDWQTALVPVFLNTFYRDIDKFKNIKTVFTIHNIQYQGKFDIRIAQDVLGLPEYANSIVEYDGCLNMMKGAIEECDIISTVSPTYASEILDPWYSHGLDRLLREKQYKLRGILNGIDINLYNPETDAALYQNYSYDDISGKAVNKAKLQSYLGLEQKPDTMMIGIVSRLVSHKGLDLVKYIFHELMCRNVQVVVLGSGEYVFESFFDEMSNIYKGRAAYVKGFIPHLARKIYAASDIFLMPSQSEPCGLAQMVAVRYGTLPVVRETGGLKDSITDVGNQNGNGYTFKTYNGHDMLGAIDRALGDYSDKQRWGSLLAQAVKSDFSWSKSAGEYIKMYKELLQ